MVTVNNLKFLIIGMGEILKPTGGSTLNDGPARGIVNVTVEPVYYSCK